MSKSKVSYKYYGFGKLIFLGLYFEKSHFWYETAQDLQSEKL